MTYKNKYTPIKRIGFFQILQTIPRKNSNTLQIFSLKSQMTLFVLDYSHQDIKGKSTLM